MQIPLHLLYSEGNANAYFVMETKLALSLVSHFIFITLEEKLKQSYSFNLVFVFYVNKV